MSVELSKKQKHRIRENVFRNRAFFLPAAVVFTASIEMTQNNFTAFRVNHRKLNAMRVNTYILEYIILYKVKRYYDAYCNFGFVQNLKKAKSPKPHAAVKEEEVRSINILCLHSSSRGESRAVPLVNWKKIKSRPPLPSRATLRIVLFAHFKRRPFYSVICERQI